MSAENARIKGLFLIIDHGNIKGLMHWCDELEKREIPVVIQTNEWMLDENCAVIRRLSDKGFEICGAYNEKPFWSQSYKFQFEVMHRIKNKIEACIAEPVRIFGSKYSAYNEDTLRAAEELGIERIFARGAAGAKAVIYKPAEYDVTIVSVSNVPSQEMGTGSLCDQSLWCRGITPDGFREILLDLKEDRFVLVAQTHLSGIKLHWWNAYQDFLDTRSVHWESLDEFSCNPLVLPNAHIPMNTEMKYETPKPKIPLEQEPDCPFTKD